MAQPQLMKTLPSIPSMQEIGEKSRTAFETQEVKTQQLESWRPRTLSKRFLTGIVALTLFIAGFLIVLQVIDIRKGALLVAVGDDFSDWQLFLFRYLPNIIIVVYGLFIAAIDLDVKRLEPWFRLSTNQPATAELSLLLRYDVDFVLTVMYQAFRRRQHIVVATSAAAILAVVIVPALQNSMFATSTKSLATNITGISHAHLISPAEQASSMSTNFLNTAYAILWANQDVPPFVTRDYALAPFKYPDPGSILRGMAVTAVTTRYWTEVNCTSPAQSTFIPSLPNGVRNTVTLGDGMGCVAEKIIEWPGNLDEETKGKYDAHYIGYLPDLIHGSPSLSKSGCVDAKHEFLAIWKFSGDHPADFNSGGNATALFCKTAYFSEPVIATVAVPDNKVLRYTSTGPTQILDDDQFNRDHFEYILTTGAAPGSLDLRLAHQLNSTKDIADVTPIALDNVLKNTSLLPTITDNMIGFIVGSTQLPSEAYLIPENLRASIQAAHRLTFSLAIGISMNINTTTSDEGVLEFNTTVVRLIPGLTIPSLVLLVCIAMVATALIPTYMSRRLQLQKDPESMAQLMLLSRDENTQRLFCGLGTASETALGEKVSSSRYILGETGSGQPTLRTVFTSRGPRGENCQSKTANSQWSNSTLPTEASWFAILPVAILVAAAIGLLGFAAHAVDLDNGFRLPLSSSFVQQLLLNFLPTILSTLLGTYISMLCRISCFLSPYKDLLRGKSKAKSSLLVRYTSLPPQIVFWPAAKAGHWDLVLLSLTTLLSNILTVAAAGLFIQRLTTVTTAHLSTQIYLPTVKNPTEYPDIAFSPDPILFAVANISNGASLPPWTIPDYGFLPMDLKATSQDQILQLNATGYGAELECQDMLRNDSSIISNFNITEDGQSFRLAANYTLSDGDIVSCWFLALLLTDDGFGELDGQLLGNKSFEISNAMAALNQSKTKEDEFCKSLIVKGWVRGQRDSNEVQSSSNSSASIGLTGFSHNQTIVSCRPKMKTQQFALFVDLNGSISQSEAISPPTFDLPPDANLTSTFKLAVALFKDNYAQPGWHNDGVARDWSNYLFKQLLKSDKLLNPEESLPSIPEASSLVSQAFSRIFALQLVMDRSYLQKIDESSFEVSQSAASSSDVNSELIFDEMRVFLSRPMYWITQTILVLTLYNVLLFQLKFGRSFLPRMPFTIASQMAYFSGSHVINDVVQSGADFRHLNEKGYRYGYGRYIGKDGLTHIGIEREPFVTLLGKQH